MLKWLFIILGMAALAGSASAGASRTLFAVKYISAENVYIDGGAADSLHIGDHLTVAANGGPVDLEIVFVSDHSASCKTSAPLTDIRVGDQVTVAVQPQAVPQTPDTTSTTAPKVEPKVAETFPPPAKTNYAKPPSTALDGNLTIGLYHWNDRGTNNLDFTQSTNRLNLRARHLGGHDITFSVRTRGRYDQRQRVYSSSVERHAWENRLWEFSLGSDDPHATIRWNIGRILPRNAVGVGYLDGATIDARLSGKFRLGAAGGSQARWLYAPDDISLTKGAVYLNYASGKYGGAFLEQSIAVVGEYHKQNVNREFLALAGRFSAGSRWWFSDNAEFDINRGWRKDKSGQTITLSSLYLSGLYRFTPAVRAGLSYDSRKNYWTYDQRGLADSLFDSHLRDGLRVQLELTPGKGFSTFSTFGYRKRAGDAKPTYSYSFNVNGSNFLRTSVTTTVMISGFSGPAEHGLNYSGRIGRPFGAVGTINAAYGVFQYSVSGESTHNSNRWMELSDQVDIGARWFMYGLIQYNTGDDIKGTRLQTDLGFRF